MIKNDGLPINQKSSPTIALVVAGGSSTRLQSDFPKPYLPLGVTAGSLPVLSYVIQKLQFCPDIDFIQIVIHQDHLELYNSIPKESNKLLPFVFGGQSRAESVLNGLEAIKALDPHYVLIHDAARPFFELKLIPEMINVLDKQASDQRACILATPVIDTIKKAYQDDQSKIETTIARDRLYAAQTPQAFDYKLIYNLVQNHRDDLAHFTDEASFCERNGISPQIVISPASNFKITTIEDYERAFAMTSLQSGNLEANYEYRTGFGFDVHQTKPGNEIILSGLKIPSPYALEGHSDADVGLHAICDAIYGAMCQGDIGTHFPPSEMKWKDKDSTFFLEHAVSLVTNAQGKITHIDLTFMCEQPKIRPHQEKMKQRLSQITNVDVNRINVKATTTEKLGFTGREEGIAAQATVTIALPLSPSPALIEG